MGIFGEPPRHVDDLKRRVRERDAQGAERVFRAYADYDDRMTAAEKALAADLDGHALAQEAALQELSNRGEGVSAASSNEHADAEAVPAAQTFRDAAE